MIYYKIKNSAPFQKKKKKKNNPAGLLRPTKVPPPPIAPGTRLLHCYYTFLSVTYRAKHVRQKRRNSRLQSAH